MNLKEIRNAMFAQSDWAPSQSAEAITRSNEFINRAYSQLMLEAPFLFFESEVHLATEPDAASLSDNDTILLLGDNVLPTTTPTTTKDPWTWTTSYTKAEAEVAGSNRTIWKYDRSWDGREIEIICDGVSYRNQIRTVWLNSSTGKYEFTLVRPWDWAGLGTGATNAFKFRIYTDAYALPDDVVEVRSTRLFEKSLYRPLEVIGQKEAEDLCLVGKRSEIASGIPRTIFRRRHIQIDGPSVAPEVSLATAVNQSTGALANQWKGPEPPGEFEYVITYTWGKRDIEFRNSGLALWRGYASDFSNENQTFEKTPSAGGVFDPAANRYREPRYESSPSPTSSKIAVVEQSSQYTGTKYPAVKLTLPNIEYALGFLGEVTASGVQTRKSLHQSGIHVRIYRRRKSATFDNYDSADTSTTLPQYVSGLKKLDTPTAFFLLAETRIDEVNNGIFYDNGEIIPDYSRRLRDTHGYQTFACYPRPDKRYVLDIRCLRRPSKLVDDEDAPLIHAEATNVLIQRAMILLYENMGEMAKAQYCDLRYQQELQTLSKRYGDLRPPATPVMRRLTRARTAFGGSRTYRKWWTTSTT